MAIKVERDEQGRVKTVVVSGGHPFENTRDALAILLLEESRRKGNSIEIPSLGITIPPYPPEADNEQ